MIHDEELENSAGSLGYCVRVEWSLTPGSGEGICQRYLWDEKAVVLSLTQECRLLLFSVHLWVHMQCFFWLDGLLCWTLLPLYAAGVNSS